MSSVEITSAILLIVLFCVLVAVIAIGANRRGK